MVGYLEQKRLENQVDLPFEDARRINMLLCFKSYLKLTYQIYVMWYPKTRLLVKIVKNDVFVYFCRAFQDLSKMLRVILIGRAVATLCGLETKPCMKDYFEKNAKTDNQTQSIINCIIKMG